MNNSEDFFKKIYLSKLIEDKILQHEVKEFRSYFLNIVIDIAVIQIDKRLKNIPSIIFYFKLITNIKKKKKSISDLQSFKSLKMIKWLYGKKCK